MKKISFLPLLGFALMLPQANATILNPGDTNVPPDVLTAPTGSPLATISGTISPGTFTAKYTEWVYSDSNNTFCSGCLDFVYQVTNDGPGVVERITGYSFGAFKVDAGYAPGTGVVPETVDRSNNGNGTGNVVGFNFLGNGELATGKTTDLLIIETDAKVFVPGLVSIQDGSAGTGNGFGPGSVPEPMSVELLGAGLALIAVSRMRRKSARG